MKARWFLLALLGLCPALARTQEQAPVMSRLPSIPSSMVYAQYGVTWAATNVGNPPKFAFEIPGLTQAPGVTVAINSPANNAQLTGVVDLRVTVNWAGQTPNGVSFCICTGPTPLNLWFIPMISEDSQNYRASLDTRVMVNGAYEFRVAAWSGTPPSSVNYASANVTTANVGNDPRPPWTMGLPGFDQPLPETVSVPANTPLRIVTGPTGSPAPGSVNLGVLSFWAEAPTTLKLVEGAGAGCVTNRQSLNKQAMPAGPSSAWSTGLRVLGPGNSLCVQSTVATRLHMSGTYVVR